MHFDLLQSIGLAGDAATPNDDRAGCGDTLAWVIDGATDLGPPGLLGERGGAAWLASVTDAAFAGVAPGSIARVCSDVFAVIERRYRSEHRREPEAAWELPSGSMLAVSIVGDQLDCGWIGDCAGLLRHGDSVRWIGAAPDRSGERAQAAALGVGIGAAKKRAPLVTADRRAARGRPGRRVLGVNAGRSQAVLTTARVPVARGDMLLLMSDGFSALVDAYGAYDGAGLIAAVEARGLAALACELRGIEAEDATCVRFPRFKRCDDATALWVQVG
ncbi:protein phosphatase 2C domain-containing protein [Sphingomonas sp. S1-29]|uniref:protein phosphatase 2C domain-containing protein n=1 Tax=Sphingomonas sp. S1-29 TaxID=2991074 RepID=UPI00223FC4E4|nr:protein phosphatase 2C domain-containing protein [Sphingomonas sp. S1-29]UZK68373.1 protein phosphatase 2C domain-containing protein [Sphingomonas sp. S1-29]